MHPSDRIPGKGFVMAEQIQSGDPYELSEGRVIYCGSTGSRGSKSNMWGGEVIETDPQVEAAGIDTGFSPNPGTLRAPDVAVGALPDTPGWVKGAPRLALEYADTGQDEQELQAKIRDLFKAGTQLIWVARLTGIKRVEVYAPGAKMKTLCMGETLKAPGILKNEIPVEALFERDAAHEATLRNLLQRKGFESVEAIWEKARLEGREQGREEGIRHSLIKILAARQIKISPEDQAKIAACSDIHRLEAWLLHAAMASTEGFVLT